jgi:hypothetical protein
MPSILDETSFAGHTFPPDGFTPLLIKYVYSGDANLDAIVDVTDLGALATNWQTANVWSGSLRFWVLTRDSEHPYPWERQQP